MSRYTNEEHLGRLQNCLKRKIVKSMVTSPRNVTEIIQMLEKKSGKSENIYAFRRNKKDNLV